MGNEFPISRDELITELHVKGIDSRPFFIPLHKLPPYRGEHKMSFPIAEHLGENGINLPSYPGLKDEQIKYICRVIKEM